MKNFFSTKTFYTFLILVGLVAVPSLALAENNFKLISSEKEFTIAPVIIDSWRGREVLQPINILAPQPENLNTSLEKLLAKNINSTRQNGQNVTSYRLEPIYNFIAETTGTLNRPAIEPVLQIDNGHVATFTPPQTGLSVSVRESALAALRSLEIGATSSSLSVLQTVPQKTLDQTNQLGINELVAQGVSNFRGSPKNRRHNIAIGLEKFSGIIINRGEEFSFNKFLGPVDGENGFLPELVIKKTGTVPEFGGGLCQVSSTAFRAAMQAGLPITQRRNHAYAVQYYAPQGTDATIYPGVVDLKFINDTPGAILVWPYLKDKDTLVFDFYGTKDSRKVTLEKPVQYDRKPDGSLKASWTRIVNKDGAEKTDVFKSTYQSPDLFHKTEQFVSATGTPTSGLVVPPQTQ